MTLCGPQQTDGENCVMRIFTVCILNKIILERLEKGRRGEARWGEMRNDTKLWDESLKERKHLGVLNIEGG